MIKKSNNLLTQLYLQISTFFCLCYTAFSAAERGLKSFLPATIDELWYQDLKDPTTFYNMVTAHNIISHLDDNCWGLHPSKLITLPGEMASYDATTTGIQEYIYAVE